MRKPSFLAVSSQVTTIANSTISVPKATVTGGSGAILLLIMITSSANTGYNVPSGFARAPSPFAVSARGDLFYRIIDGTEGSNFSVVATSGAQSLRSYSVSFQDVDPNEPFGVIGPMFQSAAGTSAAIPSIDFPDWDNSRLFSMVVRSGSGAAMTEPSGMTQDGFAVASQDVSPGATGTKTWTWTGSSVVQGVLFGLKAPQEQFVNMQPIW